MDPSKSHSNLAIDPTAKEIGTSPPAHPSRSSSSSSIPRVGSHRQSFAENLRGMPPSPRAQRHPSFTQAAIQDLLNHPPTSRSQNPRFAGRDWRDVHVSELVSGEDVRWVDMSMSVEDATMVCTGLWHLLLTRLLTESEGPPEKQHKQRRARSGRPGWNSYHLYLRLQRFECLLARCCWPGAPN